MIGPPLPARRCILSLDSWVLTLDMRHIAQFCSSCQRTGFNMSHTSWTRRQHVNPRRPTFPSPHRKGQVPTKNEIRNSGLPWRQGTCADVWMGSPHSSRNRQLQLKLKPSMPYKSQLGRGWGLGSDKIQHCVQPNPRPTWSRVVVCKTYLMRGRESVLA